MQNICILLIIPEGRIAQISAGAEQLVIADRCIFAEKPCVALSVDIIHIHGVFSVFRLYLLYRRNSDIFKDPAVFKFLCCFGKADAFSRIADPEYKRAGKKSVRLRSTVSVSVENSANMVIETVSVSTVMKKRFF